MRTALASRAGTILGALVLAVGVAACGRDAWSGPTEAASGGPSMPVAAPTAGGGPLTTTATALDLPPAASLAVEGGDPVVGQLGTYVWGDGGADSPSLPGSPVTIGAGEPLRVTVADGIGVASWTARRMPAGSTTGVGAVGIGDGGAVIAFAAPPAGTWTVAVTVRFLAGGSAVYAWQVDVP